MNKNELATKRKATDLNIEQEVLGRTNWATFFEVLESNIMEFNGRNFISFYLLQLPLYIP
jgi:hypothetical protein